MSTHKRKAIAAKRLTHGSTIKQLVRVNGTAGTSHEANFKRILPSAMDKLVANGLFEPWEGTYRITDKGRMLLAKLEKDA